MGRRGRPPYPDILTPREWEVLALLRQNLTNEAIAFDAATCSTLDTPSPVEAAPLNAAAAEIAAIVVEIPWSPTLCGPTGSLTAGAAARILEAHQAAYDALPSERVEPFVTP